MTLLIDTIELNEKNLAHNSNILNLMSKQYLFFVRSFPTDVRMVPFVDIAGRAPLYSFHHAPLYNISGQISFSQVKRTFK